MWVRFLISLDKERRQHGRNQSQPGNQQRVRDTFCLIVYNSKCQRGNKRTYIRFEKVCSHSCHITNIIADIICYDRRVSRIILRDSRLHLTNQVSSDIRCLSVDTTAHTGKQRNRGRAEAESGQYVNIPCDEVNHTYTKNAKTHNCPTGKRNRKRPVHSGFHGRVRCTYICLCRHLHTKISCKCGKCRSGHKTDSRHDASCTDADQYKKYNYKNYQNLIFCHQKRPGSFRNRVGNLLHLFRPSFLP